MRLPWLYMRRRIARAWGVPPWVVDEAPKHELDIELAILGIVGLDG